MTHFPHLSMEINDENCCIPFSKRAFYDVLEGVTSKIVLGASPQTPIFQQTTYEKGSFCIYLFAIGTDMKRANVPGFQLYFYICAFRLPPPFQFNCLRACL